MTLPQISASRLKTFRTCAKQYELKYILDRNDRPDQDKNVGAMLGTALHYAIEMYYRDGLAPVSTFQDKMSELYEEWDKAGLIIRGEDWYPKNLKDGRNILKAFQWDFFQPSALELNFLLPFPNKESPLVLINGYIDLVDMRGWTADHKSQKALPSQNELNNDVQFIIYAWAYKQIYKSLPVKQYWNHLRTNKIIEVDVVTDFDMKIERLTEDITAMLENQKYQRRLIDKVCLRECSFYERCYGAREGQSDGGSD